MYCASRPAVEMPSVPRPRGARAEASDRRRPGDVRRAGCAGVRRSCAGRPSAGPQSAARRFAGQAGWGLALWAQATAMGRQAGEGVPVVLPVPRSIPTGSARVADARARYRMSASRAASPARARGRRLGWCPKRAMLHRLRPRIREEPCPQWFACRGPARESLSFTTSGRE